MARRGALLKWSPSLGKIIEVGGPEDRPPVKYGEVHFIQTDEMEPLMSHITDEGLIFTSKSAMRRHYKEHGYEDTGGSHLTGKGLLDFRFKASKEDIKNDLLEAKRQLEYGEVPLSEREKEICRREEREYREYARRQR